MSDPEPDQIDMMSADELRAEFCGALSKLAACEKELADAKAYGRTMADRSVRQTDERLDLQALLAACEKEREELAEEVRALTEELAQARRALTERARSHARRCVHCDHWAVVDCCTICNRVDTVPGHAGISVESNLAHQVAALTKERDALLNVQAGPIVCEKHGWRGMPCVFCERDALRSELELANAMLDEDDE